MTRTSPRSDWPNQSSIAWDDPVPENSDWEWNSPECEAHQIEGRIRSALLSHPDVRFTSLIIRRTHDTVCLQGVMQVCEHVSDVAEVTDIVREVAGIERVLNHLLVQHLTPESAREPVAAS